MIRPWPNTVMLGASAALVGAAVLWPSLALGPREADSRSTADAALDRITMRERALAPDGRGYVPFGPGAGERETVLPGLELGPADAEFAFDASPEAAGALRLRAVSRPEAIVQGRVVPLLRARVLAGSAEVGHEEASPGLPGPVPARR